MTERRILTDDSVRTATTTLIPQNQIIVPIEGQDEFLSLADFGLTFESSEDEILTAIRPMIQEKYGVDLRGSSGQWAFKTQKATANRNVHVKPNSTAGSLKEYEFQVRKIESIETYTTNDVNMKITADAAVIFDSIKGDVEGEIMLATIDEAFLKEYCEKHYDWFDNDNNE